MNIKLSRLTVYVIILLIIQASTALSQNVDFKATAPNEVASGDQFRLVFSVNAQANGFKAPTIRDFSILSGPNQSSSSSMQIINNQVTRSVEYSYTFLLQAVKEGAFTIPSASVTVEGTVYHTKPIIIRVTKGSTQPRSQQNRQQQQGSPDISSSNLFVKASVNKSNPYQGEQIILTYKIYTRVPVSEYSVSKTPSLIGFWTENLIKDNAPLNQYKEVINGSEYVVAEFKKDALFAQKAGKLTIEPLQLDVIAQVERQRRRTNDPFEDFFNDSFFGGNYQNVRKTLSSNPLTINVKPLPSLSNEKDFGGAVGNFKIQTSIDKTELKANDALTLKFTVSGTGNIKLIDKPNFTFPSDFEVYDPRINDNIKVGSTGVSGTRTFEYLLVPRNHGSYTIKPSSFIYFDLSTGSFKTLNTPEFKIKVEKGTGGDSFISGDSNKENFKYIGTDIRFINTKITKLRPINSHLFGSILFWILLILPPVLFGTFLLVWQKELKKRGNIALMRNKRATKVARRRLKAAENHLKGGNQSSFCNEISSALWGYISDKFNIPRSLLSMESVTTALQEKKVKEELIQKFVDTLNNCEFARFAPGDKSQVMSNLYSEALEAITQTEQELK
mgnify:CR=1 FL=1